MALEIFSAYCLFANYIVFLPLVIADNKKL